MRLRSFLVSLSVLAVASPAYAQFCDSNSDCNDANQCTTDLCAGIPPFGTCTNPNSPSGTACGSTASTDCTNPDTCNGSGVCLANHKANGTTCTDDTNPCTFDQCSNGGCIHFAKPNGTACPDDLNQCTNDACTSATCMHPAKPSGTACGDGDSCTSNDVCNGAGTCAGTPIPDCGGCPLGAMMKGEKGRDRILEDLRAYRDQILAGTDAGQRYIDLYYRHANEVSEILAGSPQLMTDALQAARRLLPQIEGVLAGDEVLLSADDARVVDRLLAGIQRQAGWELSSDIRAFRRVLGQGGDAETLGFTVAPDSRWPLRR